MTSFSREEFYSLRRSGMGLTEIAETMGVSRNTLKSYIRRNGDVIQPAPVNHCMFCGREILPRRNRRFCSPSCRYAWNYAHRKLNANNAIGMKCEYCGKTFFAYPSSHRHFCSKKCYVASCRIREMIPDA